MEALANPLEAPEIRVPDARAQAKTPPELRTLNPPFAQTGGFASASMVKLNGRISNQTRAS